MLKLKRREFLKLAGIGGGALMAPNFAGLVPDAWAQGKAALKVSLMNDSDHLHRSKEIPSTI